MLAKTGIVPKSLVFLFGINNRSIKKINRIMQPLDDIT